MSQSFALLVPVKTLERAKSRLRASTGPAGASRAELMRAFAQDAVAAALGSPLVSRVYVVTDEPGVVEAERPGGRLAVLPDEGDGDLNRALHHAGLRARLQEPGWGVAAMCADLPALTSRDLTDALAAGLSPRCFVADASGGGTTLLAAAPGAPLDPHFGTGSAARHERSGAVPVRAAVPSLRRDVDTEDDLVAALALGVGAATAALLRRVPPPDERRRGATAGDPAP